MLLEHLWPIHFPWWVTPIGLMSGSLTVLLIMVVGLTRVCGRHRAWTVERRFASRRRGHPVELTVVPVVAPRTPLSKATVIDRSLNGLGLSIGEEVAVGTQLDARPSNASENLPWARVEVVSSVKHANGWRLGCAFVGVPAWKTLRLFE